MVVAAHQALYTGFAMEAGSIAAILIDEGYWSSAIREPTGISVESFAYELLGHRLGRGGDEAAADLHELRHRAAAAFAEYGPVARSRLLAAGLDEAGCRLAASLEERRLRDPRLLPGMSAEDRRRAAAQAAVNARTDGFIELWQAMRDLVAGTAEHDGRLFVRRGKSGREVVVTGVRPIHPTLRDKPILHLDATLRPDLARTVLPGLEVHEIEAAAPHMSLRLVVGSFGKSALCAGARPRPGGSAAAGEPARRGRRLRRWQARRVAPGRVLVVTYKDCEAAFAGIPGVEVAHFNAIAGLDAYRDVRLLVVVGRPLPRDAALAPLAGAFFRHLPARRLRPDASRRADARRQQPRGAGRCACRRQGRAAARGDLRRRGAAGDRPRPRGQPHARRSARGARARRRRAAAGARPGVAWETVRARPRSSACCSPAWRSTARRRCGCCIRSCSPASEQAKKAFRASGFKGQNPIRNTL